MLSNTLLPGDNHHQPSHHMYCLITDANGQVLLANASAQSHLSIFKGSFITTQEQLHIHEGEQTVSGTHIVNYKLVQVTWKVVPVHAGNRTISYKWIANASGHTTPVNDNPGVPEHEIKEQQLQHPTPLTNSMDSAAIDGQEQAGLQKSEQFYRSLIANSLDGILLVNAVGTITFASSSIKNILEYEADEIIGHNAFDYVHKDDQLWAWQSFQREVEHNPEIKFVVIRLKKKSGEWLWCMVRGHNLLQNTSLGSIVIYLHDDTPRKQANDALRESEKRFRSLIRDLQLGVALLDAEGKVLVYNRAIADILDIEEEKMVGYKVSQIVNEAVYENGFQYSSHHMPVAKVIKTKRSVHNVVMGINLPTRKEKVWLLVNAEPVLNEQGNISQIICSVNDITERKKLEQKLVTEKINQQKLLTQATIDGQEKERKEIGKELHDNIGQQLTTTKLFLDLAKTTADDTTNEMISLALKGISDVINEIRRMSRSLVPPTLGDLGLIDSVNDLVDSISRTQYLKIDFDYYSCNEDFISDNKKLMIFRIIQEQLNNVVKHAQARQVHIKLADKESFLLLEVTDDGDGFDLASVRKGLGLTNIKNRAELFGGHLNILSRKGSGCTLQVSIPYVFEEVTT